MFEEINNQRGERLDYSFHEGEKDSKNIVVLGHGVTGNKDRPFIVALGEGLAAQGISALRISFSGNGASGGSFIDSNISKEVDDLGAILDALVGYSIGYVGHSMGSAVGVLLTSMDDRVKFLVSLAGMVHTGAFAQREFSEVTPGQGTMWDDSDCPLSQAYMDDLMQIDTVVGCATHIRVPWLLVHGKDDDIVPVQDSHDIFQKANEPKQLIEIDGGGHIFSGDSTGVMVDKVVDWIKNQNAAIG